MEDAIDFTEEGGDCVPRFLGLPELPTPPPTAPRRGAAEERGGGGGGGAARAAVDVVDSGGGSGGAAVRPAGVGGGGTAARPAGDVVDLAGDSESDEDVPVPAKRKRQAEVESEVGRGGGRERGRGGGGGGGGGGRGRDGEAAPALAAPASERGKERCYVCYGRVFVKMKGICSHYEAHIAGGTPLERSIAEEALAEYRQRVGDQNLHLPTGGAAAAAALPDVGDDAGAAGATGGSGGVDRGDRGVDWGDGIGWGSGRKLDASLYIRRRLSHGGIGGGGGGGGRCDKGGAGGSGSRSAIFERAAGIARAREAAEAAAAGIPGSIHALVGGLPTATASAAAAAACAAADANASTTAAAATAAASAAAASAADADGSAADSPVHRAPSHSPGSGTATSVFDRSPTTPGPKAVDGYCADGADLPLPPRPQSRYRGVQWHRRAAKWQVNCHGQYAGLHVNEDDAARAYNGSAKRQGLSHFNFITRTPGDNLPQLPAAAAAEVDPQEGGTASRANQGGSGGGGGGSSGGGATAGADVTGRSLRGRRRRWRGRRRHTGERTSTMGGGGRERGNRRRRALREPGRGGRRGRRRAIYQPGKAVQVDPIKPTLKAPGTKRLKLKYVEPFSNFAFKFNLRRYDLARVCIARAGVYTRTR